MLKPKLFISHSSKNNALARTLSDRLREHFEILIDLEAIRGGDPWRKKIDKMLLDCHAAVILMTPEAQKSQWVPQEAFLLRFRRDVLQPGAGFKFVPLIVDEFKEEDLGKAPFSPAWMKETQALRIASADPAIDDLLEALRELREEARDWTDLRSILNYTAQQMEDAGSGTREEIATLLGFDEDLASVVASRPRWLAARLLQCGLVKLIGVAQKIGAFKDRPRALAMLEELAPYLWIDAEGVRPLSDVVLGPERPRPPAGLVASEKDTPKHYIQRASRSIPSWRIWPCTPGWNSDTGVVEWLTTEIRAHAEEEVLNPEKTYSEEKLLKILAEEDDSRRIVVLLPWEFARQDPRPLQDLANAFKPLTFLLPCKKVPPPLERRFPNIVSLPAPDLDQEEEMARQMFKARKALGASK